MLTVQNNPLQNILGYYFSFVLVHRTVCDADVNGDRASSRDYINLIPLHLATELIQTRFTGSSTLYICDDIFIGCKLASSAQAS